MARGSGLVSASAPVSEWEARRSPESPLRRRCRWRRTGASVCSRRRSPASSRPLTRDRRDSARTSRRRARHWARMSCFSARSSPTSILLARPSYPLESMTAKGVRWIVIAVCAAGIAGMIVGSVADNNDGRARLHISGIGSKPTGTQNVRSRQQAGHKAVCWCASRCRHERSVGDSRHLLTVVPFGCDQPHSPCTPKAPRRSLKWTERRSNVTSEVSGRRPT